jgi:hypothetical protein
MPILNSTTAVWDFGRTTYAPSQSYYFDLTTEQIFSSQCGCYTRLSPSSANASAYPMSTLRMVLCFAHARQEAERREQAMADDAAKRLESLDEP